jgi:hypothetical protein
MSALSISPAFDTVPTRPALRVVEAPRRGVRRRSPRPATRPAARPVARRTPVRLTRRGRVVAVLAFLALVLGTMTVFGGWATATLSGGTPAPVRIVEVQPGQTLYDIAGETAPSGHVREMVYRIQELNSLPTAQITEGQKLAIPQG